jgi:Flp pilus assembly protein TadB
VQKEEFPTFLNEQPTIMFGRTMRELLVITIGCTLAYVSWQDLSGLSFGAGTVIIRVIIAAILIVLSIIVALIKVAGRPLEDWAFVLVFYFLTPKVYIYMQQQEKEDSDIEDVVQVVQRQATTQSALDDDY